MPEYLEKLKAMLSSRRFALLVVAILVQLLQDVFGLDPQQANVISGMLAAWIWGDSIKETSSAGLRQLRKGES